MIPIVYTNDDVGIGNGRRVEWFREALGLVDRVGAKATFFWVPLDEDRPSSENTEWVQALRQACDAGHDVQLHGYRHDCLEFGRPQEGFRYENLDAFRRYDAEPDVWNRRYTVRRLAPMIAEGIEHYEEAFGRRPVMFRAPCGGVSDAMYHALHRQGILHSSSRVINSCSWMYTVTYDPKYRVYEEEFPARPYTVEPGVREWPLMSDYTHWGIVAGRLDDLIDLAKRDYARVAEQGPDAVIMLGHYHSMHKDWSYTVRFYEALFDWLHRQNWGPFITVRELLRSGQT